MQWAVALERSCSPRPFRHPREKEALLPPAPLASLLSEMVSAKRSIKIPRKMT